VEPSNPPAEGRGTGFLKSLPRDRFALYRSRALLEREGILPLPDIKAVYRGWRLPAPSIGGSYPEAFRLDRSIGMRRETVDLPTGEAELGTRVLLECPGTSGGWKRRPACCRRTAPLRSGPGLFGRGLKDSAGGPRPSVAGAQSCPRTTDASNLNKLRCSTGARYPFDQGKNIYGRGGRTSSTNLPHVS